MLISVRICQKLKWGYEDESKNLPTYQHSFDIYPQSYAPPFPPNIFQISNFKFQIINLSPISTTSTTY